MNSRSRDSNPDQYTCREVGRVLQAYLDGEVDADSARLVASHLESCLNCGFEAATLRRICKSLRRVELDLDPAAVDRLRRFGEGLIDGGPAGRPDVAAND